MRSIALTIFVVLFATNSFGQNDSIKRGITNADLAALPLATESLKLRGSRGYGNDTVTDEGIAHLARLKNLRSLKAGALGLTDAACASIGEMTAIEELELDSNKITGAGLRSLKSLKKLKRLNLNFNPIDENDLDVLKEFSHLEEFHFSTLGAVGDTTLRYCSEVPALRVLNLSYEDLNVTDEGLAYLSKLKNLKNVSLSNAQVTDKGLAELAKLTNLETLFLYGLRSVKPGSFAFMAKLENLKDIEISLVSLDGSDIDQIVSRPNLERLVLWNVFSDSSSRIEKLGQPKQLLIFRTNATLAREAVDDLQHATKLQSISDGLTNIDDNGIAMLSKLPDLETLYLDSPHVTKKALASLAKMKSLRTLMVTERLKIDSNEWEALGQKQLTRCLIQQFDAPYTVFYKPPLQ